MPIRRLLHVASVALAVLLAGCQEEAGTPVAAEDLLELEADMVLYGMTDYVTSEGIRQARIEADTAYFYNDSSVVRMEGFRMTIFNDDGSEKAMVTGLRGRLDRNTEHMTGYGEVVANLTDPGGGTRIIESPVLNYDPNQDRIWSDTATVYREGGRVTRGSCFSSDLQGRSVRVCAIRGAAGATIP